MLRHEAERRLAGLVAAAGHGGRRSGILFLDVDGFKQIDDRLGHEAVDRVLSEVADRLVSGVRPGDVVARFGGDELVLRLPGIGTEAALAGRAAELAAAIAEPIPVHGQPLRTGVSIGATMIPRDGASAADVLAAADAAMYDATRTDGGYRHAGRERRHGRAERAHALDRPADA
jgi:diguanylate cyclase (GGDEF)-like protein